MLEYVYHYNVHLEKAGAYRDWLIANNTALHEHQPPGWTYLGTWFSVRGFGDFHCESRFQLEDYVSLGSGFGDDESQRLSRALFDDFLDSKEDQAHGRALPITRSDNAGCRASGCSCAGP